MSKILRLPQVVEKTGLSRSTILAKLKKGEFPNKIILGKRIVGWKESDVDEWIDSCIQYDGGENEK